MERLLTLKNILPYLKLAFWPCPENNFRPIFIQKRLLALYVLLFLGLKLIIFPFYLLLPQTSFFADVISSTLVQLTNQERQAIGLNSLKVNPILTQAAYAKAQDMIAKDYFAHTSPQGVSPWYWFKAFGYNYQVAGENLAIGFVESEEVNRAWKNSASHRQNLLNSSYKEIGIAVVTGNFQGKETTLVVQFFGTPQAVLKPVAVKPTPKPSPLPATPSPLVSASPAPSNPTGLAVLGEEKTPTESPALSEAKESLSVQVADFGLTKYDQLTSQLLNFFLLLVIAFLAFNLLLNFWQGRPSSELVLHLSLFVILLFVSDLLDKQLIVSLIPHQLMI